MGKGSSSSDWTFLTNHGHVLLLVAQQPGVRMRDLAQSIGLTERSVQRILSDLEEAGYITRVRQGRRNYYEVHPELPLRHPVERHQQVSALLELVLGCHTKHDWMRTSESDSKGPISPAPPGV